LPFAFGIRDFPFTAAIYINNIWEGSIVTLDGLYKNNKHYFQHGLGGAACIEYIEGVRYNGFHEGHRSPYQHFENLSYSRTTQIMGILVCN
jgi:hypothetical protein